VEGIVAVLVVNGLGPKCTPDGHKVTIEDKQGKGMATFTREATSLDHELILDVLKVVLDKQ
jgi:hypothetical protein